MLTLLRRLFWLGLLGGAGYAAWTIWTRQREAAPAAAPEWPPMPAPAPSPQVAPVAAAPEPTVDAVPGAGAQPLADPVPDETDDAPGDAPNGGWVAPVDGACPPGYPIKANANSGIYHVPGGRFYDRTVPERCYANTADAEADGYRAAKA